MRGPRRREGVPRLDARRLGDADLDVFGGRTPVLLTHVVDAAASSSWIARLLESCGEQEVAFQTRRTRGRSEASARLRELPDVLRTSSHDESHALMSEGLLQGNEVLVDEMHAQLPAAMRHDLFAAFPEVLRPSRLCFIASGRGARCDLHADHFSWTGWNLLLRGRKRWRLFPNTEGTCTAFAGWREPFGAWDGTGSTMLFDCAGSWNSLVDLFQRRRDGGAAGAGTEEAEQPGDDAELGPDAERFPAASGAEGGVELVQGPGELLIFPGSWWHQTYAEEESWAVCAQCLRPDNVDRVLSHICDWCGLDLPDPDIGGGAAAAAARVDALLEEVLEVRGEGAFPCMGGPEVLARLRAFDRAVPLVAGTPIQSLGADDLVSLLWGCAALGCGQQSLWQALCSSVPERSSALMPGQLAAACWALARAGGRPGRGAAELRAASRLAAEAAAQVEELSPPQLAAAAWALARLPLPPALAVADEAVQRLCEFSPGHVGFAAWAVAPCACPSTSLGPALEALAAAPGLDRRGQLGTLWALAELGAGWSPLTRGMLPGLPPRVHESTPRALSHLAWAVATAAMRDRDDGILAACGHPLVLALAAQARRRAESLQPGHLARISWAFSVLSTPHAPLYSTMVSQATRRIRHFDPAGLAALAWSFATIRRREGAFLAAAPQPVMRTGQEFAPADLAAVSWSLARLAWLGGEPLQDLLPAGRCSPFRGLLVLEPEGC